MSINARAYELYIKMSYFIPFIPGVTLYLLQCKSYLCFEPYILFKIEFLRIQIEVLENVFVVHVVGVLLWDRVVAVAHHLFTGVDDRGLHYTGLSVRRFVRVVP